MKLSTCFVGDVVFVVFVAIVVNYMASCTSWLTKNYALVKSFVFSSCDFVDRFVGQKNKDDPRNHTNQHEPKNFRLG